MRARWWIGMGGVAWACGSGQTPDSPSAAPETGGTAAESPVAGAGEAEPAPEGEPTPEAAAGAARGPEQPVEPEPHGDSTAEAGAGASSEPEPNPETEEPSVAEPVEPAADPQVDAGMEEPPGADPVEAELEPMPIPRGEHGVGALNDEVYVMCGYTPQVTSRTHVYSPSTNTWREVAEVPVVCHHPNVATAQGQLLIVGFHADGGRRIADGRVFAYEPQADTWMERRAMPPGTERGASCVTTFQNQVYVFGGTNDLALNEASVYDPATDTWEVLPPMPAYRHHCVAAVVNDKIYLVSGRDVVIEEVQPESYVYDPVAQTYTELAPILTPRGGSAGAALGGRIYVFGGEGNVADPRGIFHEVEEYDPATDTWRALSNMTQPRHGFGAAVVGGVIYLPGGSTSQGIEAQSTLTAFGTVN